MKNLFALAFVLIFSAAFSQGVQKSLPLPYDTFAEFLYGDFDKYIIEHVKFPRNLNRDGDAFFAITTEIDALGNASFFKNAIKIAPEIDQAFIDVINNSPKWKPALLKGKPVKVRLASGFIVSFDRRTGKVTVRIHHFYKKHAMTVANGNGGQTTGAEPVYTTAQIKPQFNGGDKELVQFIKQGLKDKNAQGSVLASFIVEKDGHLANVRVIRAPSDEVKSDVLRILTNSPKWVPGSNNGALVRVQVMQRIALN